MTPTPRQLRVIEQIASHAHQLHYGVALLRELNAAPEMLDEIEAAATRIRSAVEGMR